MGKYWKHKCQKLLGWHEMMSSFVVKVFSILYFELRMWLFQTLWLHVEMVNWAWDKLGRVWSDGWPGIGTKR